MSYSCYVFVFRQSLLDQLAGWIFTPAALHAHGKWFAICNKKSPLTVKVTKREKIYQNASLAEYIQQSREFHVFSSVFVANSFSYCKPFPAYLLGLYIEVEEKARVRKRNISRWHVVRSSFFVPISPIKAE